MKFDGQYTFNNQIPPKEPLQLEGLCPDFFLIAYFDFQQILEYFSKENPTNLILSKRGLIGMCNVCDLKMRSNCDNLLSQS